MNEDKPEFKLMWSGPMVSRASIIGRAEAIEKYHAIVNRIKLIIVDENGVDVTAELIE